MNGVRIELFTSGIWQTNTAILSAGASCVVVDPAYFPRELATISERVAELGSAAAVIFSHGHWDHVMGHTALPEAPVWLSATLDAAIEACDPRATRYLEDAREFDSRWYVPRPDGHRWPARRRGLHDGETIEVAGMTLRSLALPGHSPDGLGIVVADALLVGDYLSPLEIPFIEDAIAYRATLTRLLELLSERVRRVVPGHGRLLTAGEARAIAEADREYIDRLLDAGARGDRAAAEATPLPRASDVVGMLEQHAENCSKLFASRQRL